MTSCDAKGLDLLGLAVLACFPYLSMSETSFGASHKAVTRISREGVEHQPLGPDGAWDTCWSSWRGLFSRTDSPITEIFQRFNPPGPSSMWKV